MLLLGATNAYAQSPLEINGQNYQLSLVGLNPRPSGSDDHVAVVVSNRTVIRHYQSAPTRIRQLRRTYGGRCGCGR